MRAIIAGFVRMGHSRKEIIHEADPETIAESILVLIEGGALLSKVIEIDTYMN